MFIKRIFKGYILFLSVLSLASSTAAILNPHHRAKVDKIATLSIVVLITSIELYAIGAMIGAAQKRRRTGSDSEAIRPSQAQTGRTEPEASYPSQAQIEAASSAPDFCSQTPLACRGCADYLGQCFYSYNAVVGATVAGEKFVCAMHPYGPGDVSDPSLQPNECPDFRTQYVIVRIQGLKDSGLWVTRKEKTVASAIAAMGNAFKLDEDEVESLLTYFKLKSPNGLPGCQFMSKYCNVEQAVEKLLAQINDQQH